MPYTDQEKQREAQRKSMAKARGVNPELCETLDVKPEANWADIMKKVHRQEDFTPAELKLILQWGIDQGKIKPRRKVIDFYGLETKFGSARLTKDALLTSLNKNLRAFDTELVYLGASAPRSDWLMQHLYSE